MMWAFAAVLVANFALALFYVASLERIWLPGVQTGSPQPVAFASWR